MEILIFVAVVEAIVFLVHDSIKRRELQLIREKNLMIEKELYKIREEILSMERDRG